MEPAEISPLTYRVTARNTARSSPNKIHDSAVATRYGFAGGLVPGVTIFAWMCAPPLDLYGQSWLERGRIEARFTSPIYEGDGAVVSGVEEDTGLTLAVRRDDQVSAIGRADPNHAEPSADIPRVARPDVPPPASPESLVAGRALGTIEVTFEAARAGEYLASIGAAHRVPAEMGVAHPGWLLLLANLALSSNVALGPWIHVSSDVRLFGTVSDGEQVSARSRIVAEYMRKDHRFVELDVSILAWDERPAARVHHVAIYEPRRLVP